MKLYVLKTIATVQGDKRPSALYFAGEAKQHKSFRHMWAHDQKFAIRFPSLKQAEEQAKVIGSGAIPVRLRRRTNPKG